MSNSNAKSKNAKETKLPPMKIYLDSGIVVLDKWPKDIVTMLCRTGAIYPLKLGNTTLYLGSYKSFSQINKNPTLELIFENATYCNCPDCKHYKGLYQEVSEYCKDCSCRDSDKSGSVNKMEFAKNECQEENRTPKQEYRQYLKSDYWKEFRETAIKHYNNTCQWCGKQIKRVANVHHIRYGERYDEDMDNVTLLCHECHQKAHGKG
jgi:hypothetical protein